MPVAPRNKSSRTKKETLKKRESKGFSAASPATPSGHAAVSAAATDIGTPGTTTSAPSSAANATTTATTTATSAAATPTDAREGRRLDGKPKDKPKKKTAAARPDDSLAPLLYDLGPPKHTDFEPPRGPVFSFHHGVTAPDGSPIEFYETSEQ